MGVSREQLQVGGRAFWKNELPRPGASAEIRLIPVEIVRVDRMAAQVRTLEGKNSKKAVIRFSHLEPDLAYLEAKDVDKEKRTEEGASEAPRKPRGRRPKTVDTLIVSSRYVRPTAHANAQDLAAVAAEDPQLPLEAPPPPHLTIVPNIATPTPSAPPAYVVPTPEPTPEPERDATQEDFAVFFEMGETLLEGMDREILACTEERVALHAKRRDVEIALEAVAKRQKSLEAKRLRIAAFIETKG
jgi:hypothetical protein